MAESFTEMWEYSSDGLQRRHTVTKERQEWNGSKWAAVRKVQPSARDDRLATAPSRQSRAMQMSPLGLQRQATSEYGERSDDGDLARIYTVTNGSLGLGVVEIIQTPSQRDVWLDENTLSRIEDNPKLFELFHKQIFQWEPGMKFLMEDVSYTSFFKDAVAAEEARKRVDAARVEVEVDTLDMLQKKADALVIQAAQSNAEPSALMAETFALRLAEIQATLADLERRFESVRDTVGLASTAVAEALSE